MPQRHTTEFPERFLNARAERFKRFGKTQRHTFHVAERQHAVKERVLKPLPCDLHAEFIADCEVARREPSRVVILSEKYRLPRTMQRTPFGDASFKRPPC
jgi:hypothetical protein